MDDHPLHLHRHSFELRVSRLPLRRPRAARRRTDIRGITKDVVLVDAQTRAEVEFTADNPGASLLHCHQQNHMDLGFMMLFDMPDRIAACWRVAALLTSALSPLLARAQTNYEIQVYGAQTVPPQALMVELHSNFTVQGQQQTLDGVYPTYHQEHETVELTEGLNDWSEVGFYIFTSEQDGHGVQWVGDHIRPRIRVPDSWGWPVGVSLSTEVGFQRSAYSPDTWTWEIRPIIDKSVGRWYFASIPRSSAPCMARMSIRDGALRRPPS